MSRSADAPPVRMPTRIRLERGGELVTTYCAPRVLPRVLPRLGVLARSKRIPALARSVALSFGGAPRLSLARTQLAASPAAIAMSPLPHQFDFWNEIDVEPLSNVPLERTIKFFTSMALASPTLTMKFACLVLT